MVCRRPVDGAVRAARMSEDRTGKSKRTDAVAFVDARSLYRDSADPGTPEAHGLYDPALDKDSCGVGFIADIKGRKSHTDRRGRAHHPGQPRASRRGRRRSARRRRRRHPGADPAQVLRPQGQGSSASRCPQPGEYGIGALFMPRDAERRELVRKTFEEVAAREGLSILGWRSDMPVDNSTLGESVKPTEPFHMQVFIGKGQNKLSEDEFERKLYILRKSISVDDLSPVRAAAVGLLPGVDLVPHRDLQGHVPRRPARHLLSRPAASRISRARWRWCTSASRPTPSRPGRWRIPTA